MNIELRHIDKRFGIVHANKDISVQFGEGRIIGVLGENGAGKSTLMKILSGFQPADTGEILINGQVVDYHGPQAAIGQGIGMLQQDPLDVGAFTVLENFSYGQPTGFLSRADRQRARFAEQARRFGFNLDPDMPVEHLAIAQRQQLEILRLLALGVKALILDEPTTGISADQKNALFAALRDLAREDGLIVLLVSHKLEDVLALCDEVIVLRAGELVGERQMPATTRDLVSLMFPEAVSPPSISSSRRGEPSLVLDKVHLRGDRLDMPDLSYSFHGGQVIGMAGLDGSGQELFMRGCAGLVKSLSGRLTLNGKPITGLSYPAMMRQGLIFGASGRLEEGLIAGLSLTEHMALMMPDDGLAVDWRAARTRMQEQIDHFRVRGRPQDRIEQLSGGNQQRVLMGLLPEEASVLVLEQPTRGLDVESANWIWQQLLKRAEAGATILFSSAELDELVHYSDRLLVFYAGRVYEVPDVKATSIEALGHMIGGDFA